MIMLWITPGYNSLYFNRKLTVLRGASGDEVSQHLVITEIEISTV